MVGPEARWSLINWLEMLEALRLMFGRKASLVTRRTAEANLYPHWMLRAARVVYTS